MAALDYEHLLHVRPFPYKHGVVLRALLKIALQFDSLAFHVHHAHLLGGFVHVIAYVPMLVQGGPFVTMGDQF